MCLTRQLNSDELRERSYYSQLDRMNRLFASIASTNNLEQSSLYKLVTPGMEGTGKQQHVSV